MLTGAFSQMKDIKDIILFPSVLHVRFQNRLNAPCTHLPTSKSDDLKS